MVRVRYFWALANQLRHPIRWERMLTRRSREILYWLSHGKTAWEISQIMGISQRTVEWRIARIRHKLGVANTTHAVAHALRNGLIDGENETSG